MNTDQKSLRIAGTAFFAINSARLMLSGDLEYSVSGVIRRPLIGMGGYGGYSETPVVGLVTAVLRDASDLDVHALQHAADFNVTLELANGKLVTGSRMNIGNQIAVNTVEGTLRVEMFGDVSDIPVAASTPGQAAPAAL